MSFLTEIYRKSQSCQASDADVTDSVLGLDVLGSTIIYPKEQYKNGEIYSVPKSALAIKLPDLGLDLISAH